MKDLSDILGLKSEPVASGLDGPAATAPAPVVREPWQRANLSKLRRFSLSVVFGLTACATAAVPGSVPVVMGDAARLPALTSPYARALAFSLAAPDEEALGPDLRLWATHYHTPEIKPAAAEMADAFPLIGRNGDPISPPLTQRDWCESALQGSVSVRTGETATAYVYVDDKGPEQANCDQWLGSLSDGVKNATRRARFMKVNHALGCGSRNHPLVPFRTIAVDPAKIPIESVVYVPELRGRAFRHNGREYVHDGYLFAGDRGGAIKGAHIDVFMVDGAAGPLEDLFASSDARTFAAHVVSKNHASARAVSITQSARCDAD
jgi:3D (Asp-Asp-Asp) domain-containing protein